ncbi:MAG TPA: hypothetical protein VD816_16495 [Ohtaekwangia sp.]|nr:hypothetical protein [Ohtaekwangia sp.]
MDETLRVLEAMSYLVTILGVPVAIYLFYRERRKERLAREAETYQTMNDKYLEFLALCLEHSSFLNIYDDENARFEKYSKHEQDKVVVLFDILVSIFERAFMMYRYQNDRLRAKQWKGWSAFIEGWMKRDDFRFCWKHHLTGQWEVGFNNYMDKLYHQHVPVAKNAGSPSGIRLPQPGKLPERP